MFNLFKKKKIFVEELIVKELFPAMKTEILDGHAVCIDYSIDANLEAVYQDILDNNINDQTKNSLKYCLERLDKVRSILREKKTYPINFEFYVVGANSTDISNDIQPKEEKNSEAFMSNFDLIKRD